MNIGEIVRALPNEEAPIVNRKVHHLLKRSGVNKGHVPLPAFLEKMLSFDGDGVSALPRHMRWVTLPPPFVEKYRSQGFAVASRCLPPGTPLEPSLSPRRLFARETTSVRICGSAAFSDEQLHRIIESTRPKSSGTKNASESDGDGDDGTGRNRFVVVDLRREPHCHLNGVPVSLYTPPDNRWRQHSARLHAHSHEHDGAVLGMLRAAQSEGRRVRAWRGQAGGMGRGALKCAGLGGVGGGRLEWVRVDSVRAEREVAQGAGAEYLRLPVNDHAIPDRGVTSDFVQFCAAAGIWGPRSVSGSILAAEGESTTSATSSAATGTTPKKDLSVHFHCRAGRGRTTMFMAMLHLLQLGQVFDDAFAYTIKQAHKRARIHPEVVDSIGRKRLYFAPSISAQAVREVVSLHHSAGGKHIHRCNSVAQSPSLTRAEFVRNFADFAFSGLTTWDQFKP
ncbi:hypothetical protein Pelo_4315 [Pelomyxa schiedti]|nr:hypothetical protein Pelo_4315 [Pelomyxa schiedti]